MFRGFLGASEGHFWSQKCWNLTVFRGFPGASVPAATAADVENDPPTEAQAVCETLASTRANAEPEAKLAPLDTLWKASRGPTTKAQALRAARAQRDPPNQSSSFFVRRASQHTSQRGAGSETRTLISGHKPDRTTKS